MRIFMNLSMSSDYSGDDLIAVFYLNSDLIAVLKDLKRAFDSIRYVKPYCISVFEYSPMLLRHVYTDDEKDAEFKETIWDEEWVCNEDIDLENVEYERRGCCKLSVTDDGFYWTIYPKYISCSGETPSFSWDMLEEA